MASLAIAIEGTSPLQVETFVRADVPDGWEPPPGRVAIPEDDLPAGWVMAPQSPPPQPPASVSPYQFRTWLVRNGISMAQIDALIDGLEDQTERDIVRVAWEYGLEVRRGHPMVADFAAALGMTEEDIDRAFIEAAGIA